MPSTSKKQHNFMSAIAHSPSFAKKVGVSQSVGKDFSAADKGRKFGRAGSINKQDTQHRSMDMPFKSFKKFGGMMSGGKVKRYAGDDESEVFNDNRPFAETKATEERTTTREVPAEPTAPASAKSSGSTGFNAAFKKAMDDSKTSGAKTFEYGGKNFALGYAKPETPAYRDEGKNVPRRETVTETVATPAVTGRAAKESKYAPSSSRKQQNAETLQAVLEPMVTAIPAAKLLQGARGVARLAESRSMLQGMPRVPPRNAILDEARKTAIERGRARQTFTERAKDTMQGEGGRKKGGMVGGMHKMPKGKMIKDSAMKKGGMPMKDGKPAFMRKFAKGGGIESRGKTKGTVIRMASGGSVSARADGIAQRGKTKFKMC